MASTAIRLTTRLLTLAAPVLAQQPPRPVDPTRSVTLSLAEYNRLIDLANSPPQGPPVPPVAAVLASASLRVRVDGDTARGVFDVNGEVLRAGVSRVSLVSGATLLDATEGGGPLPLVAEGNAHSALISGPGPFSATLEWGTPLIFGSGRASFVLPVPQAGSARATIDLPGEQADVHLSAGLVTARTVANGRTVVDLTARSGLGHRGVVVDARQRPCGGRTRGAHAGGRDDVDHPRRFGRADGGAHQSHRRPG